MSKAELMADRLYEASTRATWYQTGEARLLTAASVAIRGHDHDIAQAVAIEREAIAGWHEGERDLCVATQRDYQLRGLLELAGGAKDTAHFHQQAAQAIRNGEHVKP